MNFKTSELMIYETNEDLRKDSSFFSSMLHIVKLNEKEIRFSLNAVLKEKRNDAFSIIVS